MLTDTLLPTEASAFTPVQAALVLRAAAAGTLEAVGVSEATLAELVAILGPVRQLDVDGNVSVPLDVLVSAGTIAEAVAACR